MSRMLDALKNLEGDVGATLPSPVPVVAPNPAVTAPATPAPIQPVPAANPYKLQPRPSAAPAGQSPPGQNPTQTPPAKSAGGAFLATLAASAENPKGGAVPAIMSTPQSSAAATLARLKAATPNQPAPVARTAPTGPAAPPSQPAQPPIFAEAVSAPVVAEPIGGPAMPPAAASSIPAVAAASPQIAVPNAPDDLPLPQPRSTNTRLEESVKAALADPRRMAPLDQLARRLKTELRPDAGRCWLMASAGEHQDSSDLVAHLGALFASQLGDVLLVDASLDCAILSAGMNALDRPGLIQAGDGTRTWQNLILPTAWPHLYLLPAGQDVRDMADPTSAWTSLLAQAERRFRLILVDGGKADDQSCTTLSRICDATYLVIRLGVTEARQARQSLARLRNCGARVMGSIATSPSTL